MEGRFYNVETRQKKEAKAGTPLELLIERAMTAFVDFTSSGHTFLYYPDRVIPEEKIIGIRTKLVDKISRAEFTDRECAFTALAILTGMREEVVLPSAKGSYLEDQSIRPRIPFDPVLTNTKLIPEALEYAQRELHF
ncbi:MAG: hypothetical protein AABX04_06240 [Nanoarchaeota archaeon]